MRTKRVSLKSMTDGNARADYSPINQAWIVTWHGRVQGVKNTREEAQSQVWQLAALDNQKGR